MGEPGISDIKAYYNTTAINRIQYCFKIRPVRQNKKLGDTYLKLKQKRQLFNRQF